jgi:hypothetical protein
MIGCGFHAGAAVVDARSGGGDDAVPDGALVSLAPICPSMPLPFQASACATPTSPVIEVSTNASIDTAAGTSNVSGLTCARVTNTADPTINTICVIVAPTIVIDPGVVLSAHGQHPFALFAHSITIRGTIDIASHILNGTNGAIGAGSLVGGCSTGTAPGGAGGGRGGNYAEAGGQGGDEGTTPNTGGRGGGTFNINELQGGCNGSRGGDGTGAGEALGGAGGGVVWIVSDTAPLVVAAGAIINASGASGAGGAVRGGGSGGGSGGMIVLQSPAITVDPGAMIFANGGHGGGGGGNTGPSSSPGNPGTDPASPTSGGDGGLGGFDIAPPPPAPATGNGAPGYPFTGTMRNGQGGVTTGHGGGGGGGAPGAIRVVTSGVFTAGTNVSPAPIRLQ